MNSDFIVGKNWRKEKDVSVKIDVPTAASKMKVTYTYTEKNGGSANPKASSKEPELYAEDIQQQIDSVMKNLAVNSESASGKMDAKKKPNDIIDTSPQQLIIDQEGSLMKERLKNLKASYSETYKVLIRIHYNHNFSSM